jgi:hypothetical protein
LGVSEGQRASRKLCTPRDIILLQWKGAAEGPCPSKAKKWTNKKRRRGVIGDDGRESAKMGNMEKVGMFV